MAKCRMVRHVRLTNLLPLDPGRAVMRSAGNQIVAKTRARTKAGQGEGNRFFKAYAAGSDKSGQRVDLTETGQMLNDYAVLETTERYAGLGFRTTRSAQLAAWHESGTRHLPARPFLGIPATWVTEVVRQISAAIGARLRRSR